MDVATISIIVTTVMTVATAFMAIATMQSAKEMNLTRKETNRAYLVAYFKMVGSEFYLIIKNFGGTAAHKITISSDSPEEYYSSPFEPIFDRKIDIIAPDSEVNIRLKYEEEETQKELPKISLILNYNDIYDEEHFEKYDLDISYMEDMDSSTNPMAPIFNHIVEEYYSGKKKINPKHVLMANTKKIMDKNKK